MYTVKTSIMTMYDALKEPTTKELKINFGGYGG